MPIPAGIPAPDFELLDDTNTPRKLSDFRGKNVVLYFYPEDDTPGCTKKFKKKFQLPFPLLADIGHKICDLYGTWGPKNLMGREYEGVLRTTFLIDKNGKIVKVFEKVRPAGHSEEVLSALEVAR
jgi:peroxiredoxin Q/BCP